MTATDERDTGGEPRTVALEAISIEEGFNPRESCEPKELAKLTDSVRRHGVLQPLEVAPAGDGRYRLIAGHRRYIASSEAGLTEVPVLVRADADSDLRGLDHAIIENVLRSDLNPVEEARAYKRLMDAAGLTRRGVAEHCSVPQRRVTERLQILELPEALHARVADGTIPASAIRRLAELAKAHPALATLAVARVGQPSRHQWDEPVSWADVCADPFGVASGRYPDEAGDLPDGVFDSDAAYPLSAFALSERATKDAARLCELRGCEPGALGVRFDRVAVEHAQKLGAAFPADRTHNVVIVGQELADELAADVLGRALKAERAQAREAAEGEDARSAGAVAGAPTQARSEEEIKEERRREREAEAEARRRATAFNEELGIAVVKTLSKTKIDERVVKILAAVDFDGELEKIAMRGARYGFPGWVEAAETRPDRPPKRVYLETRAAGDRARGYLAAARTASDHAGRLLALVVMAHLADEAAVAQSRRSFFALRFGGYFQDVLPWSRDTLGLIEEIAFERLPEHLTAAARVRTDERKASEAETRAAAEARDGAIADLRRRLPELSGEERQAAVFALQNEHGWHESLSELHREVRRLAEAGAAAQAASEGADAACNASREPGAAGDCAEGSEPAGEAERGDGADGGETGGGG